MVTSTEPGEGKSTSTANLAAVFAESGAAVLVVNCDFRRPSIHKFFGVEDEPRRVQATQIPGVKIVTNVLNDPAANPSQVVAAQRQVVASARSRFDVILLDTAPLLTANDAIDMVSSADLVVIVARSEETGFESATRASELLNRLDAPLGGVILTAVKGGSNEYYYYYRPGRAEGARPPQPDTGAAAVSRVAVNGNGSAKPGTPGGSAAPPTPSVDTDLFGSPEPDPLAPIDVPKQD
jgi:Mrp family chromosome partitioning ATPase